MATSSTYYLNAPSLGSATAVFTNSTLATCAADGFYSDGVITREQVGCVLLPQQTCPACNSEVYTIDSFTTGSSASACGTGSPSVTIYALPGYTVPIVTMIFYTDLALTTPFVGGAGWRKFTNGTTNYAGEVDATGELTNYVTC